ncbi:AmmeMemoRadiSam system radical SAM enzyme [Sulfurimonas sp.]|uniref:AmmeMemoRadiSam system radical SAM enzyme n=1 Tax=Sulfurimonas sp. TaxID=2022749 RepID=UPI0025CC8079|nr:AmmeMemoRadiSam system radical SAM enzyme [Sulfurimonas sp.]MDD5157826.1 AmmeMemoRadiSam system radical SAM enzyme [Sulfurimonas sp.]
MSSVAWLSKKLDDGRIMCEACNQHCKLNDGEYGICGVRKVENGELQLLTYGIAAAVNVDPVEKKPMFHFLPDSKVLSFGTVGCNFSCKFCQNADISQYPQEHHHEIIGRSLSPQAVVELALEYKCKSIAYTYNEPAIFFEYAYDTAKLAHEAGLKNIYVTNGYETHKAIDTIAPYLDAMNIDIKGFSKEFYEDICGGALKPVLDTIEYARKKGIWIETTTLLIPGYNDSDEEIRAIATFQATLDSSMPWHISAFHPMYKMLDVPKTPAKTLRRAYEIGKKAGLKYVYVGNIDDGLRESTYCPNCNKIVIERHGNIGQYITNHLLEMDSCPFCATKIDGVWS